MTLSPADPYRLIIFDCDGTLVDSQHNIIAAMQKAFRSAGSPLPTPEAIRRQVGLSLEVAIARLLPDTDEKDVLDLAENYRVAVRALRAGEGLSGIIGNAFQNMGSNSIQAKGGTSDIEILRNTFKNGGARAMNLGGSTGLAFFRPQNATTEAERIKVIANVIEGSEAAIAFVGCRNVHVSNNTIVRPRKWILRILQETVDPTRFLPCGDNSFFNNLVIIDQNVSVEANIGPNTAPETFLFDHNLWWKAGSTNWNGPNLPGIVSNNIIGDPMILPNSTYLIPSSNQPRFLQTSRLYFRASYSICSAIRLRRSPQIKNPHLSVV